MRILLGWYVLALILLLLPTQVATAQILNYEVPYSHGYLPGPLGHPRYEEGGFFVAIDGLLYKMTNPVVSQSVAVRGFVDVDGSITGVAGSQVGSFTEALNTTQVSGPGTYQPGFNLTAGWRFENGITLMANWMHLWESRYSATASIIPPGFAVQQDLSDTFLFSPVVNFPVEYAGQAQNVSAGNPGATFGIWNASGQMTIDFIQRFDYFDLTARVPLWETMSSRSYVEFGPRIVWLFERFRWRTVSQDLNGLAAADDVANYTNVVSQRFYGAHCGAGHEWYLGSSMLGAFSVSVDGEFALYGNFAKLRPKYALGDKSTAASRAINDFTVVPEVRANVHLWWFPIEGIQVRAGYDIMAFFNTMAAKRPIDFNFGAIAPPYEKWVTRLVDGFNFGIAFIF